MNYKIENKLISIEQGDLPRKLTPIGTLGDVGAAYTIYEKNWFCKDCNKENYARSERCYRCRAPKSISSLQSKDSNSFVLEGSIGESNPWREAFDPLTNKIYYYHLETNETCWERPKVMGIAPLNTGWFGRGYTGETNANKYEELNNKLLKRPARIQVESNTLTNNVKTQLEGAYEYNIWYDKYIGDHWGNEKIHELSETKCSIELDGGYTKADKIKRTNIYFCLHFARGMCNKGSSCYYYHRLPTMKDEINIGMMHDCFGRQRHATDKDDMTGVGNFTRNSRTLYVGGFININNVTNDMIRNSFAEFGEVENVNIIHRLSISFVRFRHRTCAEFAKEAMMNQCICPNKNGKNNEILNIKWAFDDPNPVAKEAAMRSDHDAIVAMLNAKAINTTNLLHTNENENENKNDNDNSDNSENNNDNNTMSKSKREYNEFNNEINEQQEKKRKIINDYDSIGYAINNINE